MTPTTRSCPLGPSYEGTTEDELLDDTSAISCRRWRQHGGVSWYGEHDLVRKDMTSFRTGDAIVITGAAQGIGRAVALEMARRGAQLALWDVLRDGLAETKAQCLHMRGDVITRQVDVS